MGLLDTMQFEPDEELRQFLLEYDRTDGRMNETPEQAVKASRSVGQRIKLTNLNHIRRTRHLTQAELADQAGVSRWIISRIENGACEPSVFIALALSEALECSVDELFHLKAPILPRNDFDKDTWMVMSKIRGERRGYF